MIAVGPGREAPPLETGIGVELLEPRKLAVAWMGSPCDANTTLIVGGTAAHLSVVVNRGIPSEGCRPGDVIYEAILELTVDVAVDRVNARLEPAP